MRNLLSVLVLMISFALGAKPVNACLGGKESLEGQPDGELTAAAYIQDGLIAMWDAKENMGWGVHDPEARVWYALVGGGILNLPNAAMFTDKGLLFDRTMTSGRSAVTSQLDAPFWTDYVAALDAKTATFENCYTLNDYGESAGTGLAYISRNVVNVIGEGAYGFLCPQHRTAIYFNTNAKGLGSYWLQTGERVEGTHTLSGIFNPNGIRIYASLYYDGLHKTSNVVPTSAVADDDINYTSLYTGSFMIGARYKGATVDVIHNFRIYNRVLSSDEIRYNALVDRIRFGL